MFKNKKIYVTLVVSLILIIFGIGKVNGETYDGINIESIGYMEADGANAVGKDIRLGDGYLYYENTYCLERALRRGNGVYTITGYSVMNANTSSEDAEWLYLYGGGDYPTHSYSTRGQQASIRQYAIWNKIEGSTPNELNNEAKKYAEGKLEGYGLAYIQNVGATTVMATDIAGPFKVKYSGEITSVVIKDNDGNTISGTICNSNGTPKQNGIKDIKSEEEFYIKNTSNKAIKSVTINVEGKVLCAKVWYLSAADYNPNVQDLVHVIPYTEESKASVTIEVKGGGTITLNKTDKNTGEKLNGAKFVLKVGNEYIGNGNTTYRKFSEAKNNPFVVSNGTLTISNLKYGSYNIYETEAPTGYSLENQEGISQSKEFVTVATNVIVNSSTPNVSVNITNKAPDGSLTINKVDEKGRRLNGAKFVLKIGDEYIGNGNTTYKWFNDAKRNPYVVNGSLTISGLKYGTYTIYEVEAPDGYNIEDQDGVSGSREYVVCGSKTVGKNGSSIRVVNKKTPDEPDSPKIKVKKIDSDGSGKTIGGVGFELERKVYTTKYKYKRYTYFVKKDERGNNMKDAEGNLIYEETPVITNWEFDNMSFAQEGTTSTYKYKYEYQNESYDDYDWENVNSATTNSNGIADFGEVKDPRQSTDLEEYDETEYRLRELNTPDGYYNSSRYYYYTYFTITYNEYLKEEDIVVTITNRKNKITVYKKDLDTNQSLANVEFELYDSNNRRVPLVKDSPDGAYNYDPEGSGMTLTTNGSGKILIGRVLPGTYRLKEIKTGQEYDLYTWNESRQPYDGEEGGTTATISFSGGEQSYTIYNRKKVSVKGYVFEDGHPSKGSQYNSLYDAGENRLSGVSVTLKTLNGEVVSSTSTDSNGEYEIKNAIDRYNASNYYIEFSYGNGDYKKAIPVELNMGADNGSKALEDSIPLRDSDNPGIATTNKNTGLQPLYSNPSTSDTIENVNLGIKRIPEQEFTIDENLAYVVIKIKGYSYKYIYGGTGNTSLISAPTVSFQSENDITAYTREIYPSDIAYKNETNPEEELKVDVTYRIDVTNLANLNIEDLYQEQRLVVTSLRNKFDTERYTLNDANWDGTGDTVQYKNRMYVPKDGTSTAFITFSVKHDALLKILNSPEGVIEDLPTEAIARGYHEYQRKDYGWSYNITKANNPHITDEKEHSDEAPYLIFKLGQQREISGRVFEDKVVTSNGEILGNGVYDGEEKVLSNVIVELLDVNTDNSDFTDLSVSNLYDVEGTPRKSISREAKTTTDENGNYTLTGIVPGEYYLRYTYGDGTQKIYDAEGNETTIEAMNYKSTIVTNEAAANALGYNTNVYGNTWYQHLNTVDASVAVDSMKSRKAVNAGESNNIKAGTAIFAVKLENTTVDESTVDTEGKIFANDENRYIRGFNFGIIKQPKQKIQAEKLITNLRLTNAQNNNIVIGNPEKDLMPGVRDIDFKDNGGSTRTIVEVNPEEIYGNTLELTYKISVRNISDVNYYGERYYWFGDNAGAHEVTLTVDEVTDYLDEKMTYTKASDGMTVNVTNDIRTNDEANEIKSRIVKITGWNQSLFTENNKSRTVEKNTSESMDFITERILSRDDDNLETINKAQITQVKVTTDPEDTRTEKTEEIKTITPKVELGEEPEVVTTVIPATGEDKATPNIYIAIITITLIFGALLIIPIKKWINSIEKKN